MALQDSIRTKSAIACIVGITAVIATLFAGCTEPETAPTATIDFVIEGATPTPPADLSEKRGGTLLFPIGECRAPDPAFPEFFEDIDIAYEVHAGLTRFAPIDGWSVVPELAESWQSDQSGQTFTFRLRPNLKFADGSPIAASDVKWSWERTLKLQDDFRLASSVFKVVEGHDDFVAGNTPELSGIDTTDDLTVRVTLNEPTPHFPMLIAHSVASVVSQDSQSSWKQIKSSAASGFAPWADSAAKSWPTGAGPFNPDSFDTFTGGCTLVRNSNYWGQQAYLDAVNLVPTNLQPRGDGSVWFDAAGRDAAFRKDEIDYQDLNDRVYRVPKSVADGLPVAPVTVDYLVFNLDLPPFDNLHFRRALMQVSPVIQLKGETEHWIIPQWLRPPDSRVDLPDVNMSAKDLLELCECADLYENQTFAVTAYMKQFGQPESVDDTVILKFDIWPELDAVFRAWRLATGVTAETKMVFVHEDTEVPPESNPPVWQRSQDPDIPDPASIIDTILSQEQLQASFPALFNLARQAHSEADPQQRMELYLQVEREILENAIAFPIGTGIPPRHRLKPWVHGFVN